MLMLTNQTELKQIYTVESNPIDSYDYSRNIGYYHGLSTWNNNCFDPYIDKLVNAGILKKEYDFIENGIREALYTFTKDNKQLDFFGSNHMNYRIFYNY